VCVEFVIMAAAAHTEEEMEEEEELTLEERENIAAHFIRSSPPGQIGIVAGGKGAPSGDARAWVGIS
jgi:hypothetical protein